jgi:hypothetical protein
VTLAKWLGIERLWISADGRPLAAKLGTGTATYTHKPADEVPVIEVPDRFRAKALRYIESLSPTNLR